MNPSRPDVVFDCNTLFQAMSRANGPAAHALRLVEQNLITLHISKAVLRELRRILDYPELREKNPHLTREVIDEFLVRLVFRGVLQRDVPHIFTYPRDPEDEPYLDLAAAVQADYLVTRDNDLLALATDHSIEAKQFRQRLPQLQVVSPVAFLEAMEAR